MSFSLVTLNDAPEKFTWVANGIIEDYMATHQNLMYLATDEPAFLGPGISILDLDMMTTNDEEIHDFGIALVQLFAELGKRPITRFCRMTKRTDDDMWFENRFVSVRLNAQSYSNGSVLRFACLAR